MDAPRRILVFHTAFPGDIVLTTPVARSLRAGFPSSEIAFVTTPAASGLLANHPAIDRLFAYDKRGVDRGLAGALKFSDALRHEAFDVAVVPHRSLRSAFVVWRAGIPRRIGFGRSAGRFLFTDAVPYRRDAHEIDRNLDLLAPLGIEPEPGACPSLYPGPGDIAVVDRFLDEAGFGSAAEHELVALAPGSVWATKRWPAERYAALAGDLAARGRPVVLIGGEADVPLCSEILLKAGGTTTRSAAGRLSLLQSAELIRRCSVLVSNDSAPVHLAAAVGTPVIVIFGPTVPEFGFAPRAPRGRVVETEGLRCRPCAVHGGPTCPIRTFDCMLRISPDRVGGEVRSVLQSLSTRGRHGAHQERHS